MTYPVSEWRLLKSPPAEGAWNMAVDEAILEAAGRGESPPTLRLFDWEPACISIGYAQPLADVDRTRLDRLGWGMVRRPTGGRAILHTRELTYSVIGPDSDPRLVGSVIESYRRLAEAVLQALHLLELPAETQPAASIPPKVGFNGPVCFEVPSNYEIVINKKKLVGSAQARKRGGVLQHGSLPLHGDLGQITQALALADDEEREQVSARVKTRAITVEEAIGKVISWEKAAEAFETAFSQVLDLVLKPAELTPGECERASELVTNKYANSRWTERL